MITTNLENTVDGTGMDFQDMENYTIENGSTIFQIGELNGMPVTISFYQEDEQTAICEGIEANQATAYDTEGTNHCDGDGEQWISIYRKYVDDIEFYAVIVKLMGDDLESAGMGTDYYYYFDVDVLIQRIKEAIKNSDFELVEMYDKVKTNDLIVGIEEEIVRPQVQQGIPFFYEGYYSAGDATEEQIQEFATNNNIEADEVFTHMDNLHESLIQEAIVEYYGDESTARLNLVLHGIHEGKL